MLRISAAPALPLQYLSLLGRLQLFFLVLAGVTLVPIEVGGPQRCDEDRTQREAAPRVASQVLEELRRYPRRCKRGGAVFVVGHRPPHEVHALEAMHTAQREAPIAEQAASRNR